VELLLISGIVVVAGVLIGRHASRPSEGDGFLTATLRGWTQPEWPRGVQEEEPLLWRRSVAVPVAPAVATRARKDSACDVRPDRVVRRRNGFPVRVA
jgi:hypothetical protein